MTSVNGHPETILLPVLQYDHRSPKYCMLKGLVLVLVEGRTDIYVRIGIWNDNANSSAIDPFGWLKEAAEQEERVITLVSSWISAKAFHEGPGRQLALRTLRYSLLGSMTDDIDVSKSDDRD